MSETSSRRHFVRRIHLWLTEEDDRHVQETADQFGISVQDAARLLLHLGCNKLSALAKAILIVEGKEDEKQSEMRPHE